MVVIAINMLAMRVGRLKILENIGIRWSMPNGESKHMFVI